MVIKSFICKNCGAAVTIRAQGRSVSAICESCHSVIDLTDENYKIITQANEKIKVDPLIPLGERGFLQGIQWEAIGFMQKEDIEYHYTWEEYLLFNPYYGYKWLVQSAGHWNLIETIKEKPLSTKDSGNRVGAELKGHKYYLYSNGFAQVNFVLGEFYWRIKFDDKVSVSDYICPPYILSCEVVSEGKNKEKTWSCGEYIESAEIERAFNLQNSLPPKEGISPNQPSIYENNKVSKYFFSFLFIIFILQIAQTMVADNKIIYTNTYTANNTQPFTTPPFELKGGLANVELNISAPTLHNNWLSLEGELVNEKTGRIYPFDKSIEYYTGYDPEDGAWTEGSKNGDSLLTDINDGIYHINFEPPSSETAGQTFTLTIKKGVPTWGNFWFAIFLLIIPYIIYWFNKQGFEAKRWADSDYSPYSSSEGGDDE